MTSLSMLATPDMTDSSGVDTLSPRLEVVEQLSPVERVCRIQNAFQDQLQHQWLEEATGRWGNCCHPGSAAEGLQRVRKQCARFAQIENILRLEGVRGLRRRIIGRQD